MDPARQQIQDALLSYTRGVDRLRADDIAAAFHPGALLHGYGRDGPMTIEAFANFVPQALEARYVATQHRVTNMRVEFVSEGVARVETYVEASHAQALADDGTQRLHIFAGRYIDRCTPGDDGVWRIAERTLRCDWTKVDTVSEHMRGGYVPSGRGDEPDPLFEIEG